MSSSKTSSKGACKEKKEEKDTSQVHKLSLKGSSKLVAEFFQYSIHTILFQRGVYPAEDFSPVKKYGLNMLLSTDSSVRSYIKKIMSQLDRWMLHGKISKLVIVITDKETGENVERWQFDVQIFDRKLKTVAALQHQQPSASGGGAGGVEGGQENAGGYGKGKVEAPEAKSEKQIQDEIAAIFRQITASVTFLPQLDAGACTFNVLVYADADSEVPVEWGDSDAKEIEGAERVQLRGFSTNKHQIDTLVSYKMGE